MCFVSTKRPGEEAITGQREAEEMKPLGIPRHRWENIIKMYLREIGLEGVDWIHFAQVAGSCEDGNGASGSIKGREFLVQLSILSASQEAPLRQLFNYSRICGSHGSEYEDGCLLGCSTV
jgi:hypothetical protein